MAGGFEDFTEAVAKASGAARVAVNTPDLSRVAVLGGGVEGRLLAALCLAADADVTLFSAYGAEVQMLRASSGVTIRGDGPVGTYAVDRDAGPDSAPSIRTTAELDGAVAKADVIFLTGPVHKMRTYAMVLADHLRDGQVLVLAPGRSLGALEAAWMLRIGGCKADITLVEAQGLPYWISETGATLTLSAVGPVAAATLPRGRSDVLRGLARYLPDLVEQASVLESGFADGSALVELPALLLGGPGLEGAGAPVPMGGVPLDENETFASLIGPQHRAVIERLAQERRLVAQAFGLRNLPDTDSWVRTQAGALRGAGARGIPDRKAANILMRDGVIGSFVPLISAAKLAGIDVPVTQSMVTLASSILGADVAAAGRRLDTIGIEASDIDSARRVMDTIAGGTRVWTQT
ncbi:MAG: NAD/NADP octopine/nopaline dehydrogenase family protein [Rhodobacteraceae bacterium]|nr:NAD/NADP octopine/nopaline dehydrogenase family protein [Paracoccaceae bacterium]